MNISGIHSSEWSYQSPISPKRTAHDGNPDSGSAVGDLSDTVDLSTAEESGNTTDRPGIYVGPDGRIDVNINDALTTQDKQLVIAATGGLNLIGSNGTHQINYLAMRIAMDRAIGNLNGPVTASYLNNIMGSQSRDLELNQEQAAALDSAGDTASANALRTMAPGISLDVLDRALAFLAQNPGT